MTIRLFFAFFAGLGLYPQSGNPPFVQQAEQLVRDRKCDAPKRFPLPELDSAQMESGDGMRLAIALNNLGTICHGAASVHHASWYYQKAIALCERAPSSKALAIPLINLGNLRIQEGLLGEAEKLYRRASGVLEGHVEAAPAEAAGVHNGLAELSVKRGRYADAEQHARRALAISERAGLRGNERGVALFLLATIRLLQGQPGAAEDQLREAIRSWELTLGRRHQTTASGLACLASLISRASPEESDQLFREAVEVYEHELGGEHPEIGTVLAGYAKFLRQRGRKQEAKALERRTAAIAELHRNEHPGRHTIDWSALQPRKSPRESR